MKTPADGWDADERQLLDRMKPALEELQRRHAADPPFDMLRAASEGVLPDEEQASTARYLEASAWSRLLVQGADDGGDLLTSEERTQLLRRIEADRASDRTAKARIWRWLPAAAAVVAATAGSVWWLTRSGPAPKPETQTAVEESARAPVFVLPLDKPEIRISAATLTYRGTGTGSGLLADLKPAFDALRRDDCVTAVRELAPLADRYPAAVEVPYYRGVCQLLLADVAAGRVSLSRAAQLADNGFAPDVAWYQAVASERAGDRDDARSRLRALCARGAVRSAQACAAEQKFR